MILLPFCVILSAELICEYHIFLALFGDYTMYKTEKDRQLSFFDFNQSCGMQLDSNNEWVQLADTIPWERAEEEYAALFPSKTGHPAYPLRVALGALIIQSRKGLSDRKLVQEITENPYLQYFIGHEEFQSERPFEASSLVIFRKRISTDFLISFNDTFLETAEVTSEHSGKNENFRAKIANEEDEYGNMGTAIIDATVSPSNIRYPQDFSLLNEAREKLEAMIDSMHEHYHPWKKPRTYRRVARKEYLTMAKSKKRTAKKLRMHIRRELERVKRDLGHLEKYMSEGYALESQYIEQYLVIQELYRQQKYMYDERTHVVENRIVSIDQPYIRPIVRGKAKAPVEFGAKYDVSIDEKGHARLEKISFDPYNESTIFQDAIERYYERTGHYPRRVLVDQIYRTRDNIKYCNERHIELSGPKLGRPTKEKSKPTAAERQDNIDRSEIERFFSLDKRCNGAGLITAKLEGTTLTMIALTILVTNLFMVPVEHFFVLYFGESYNGHFEQHYIEFEDHF